MCTVVILRRPDAAWPLILAANRDERVARPWQAPDRHWPDRPDVVAGRDELAGGTWLGLNDTGVVAAVMNRGGSLGPDPDKRSRGELVLEALDHADADAAVEALCHLDGNAYPPFNLVIADNRDAYWLKSVGDGRALATPINAGVSMLTARDLNDTSSPRIAAFLPLFEEAEPPDPENANWDRWQALMAADRPEDPTLPLTSIAIDPSDGYGTISGSLIALPRDIAQNRPVWRFCGGRPGIVPYEDITP
jgi:uncharacterized protein with NRDE domain